MNRFRVVRILLVVFAAVAGLGLLGVLALHIYGAYRLSSVTKRYEREIAPLSMLTSIRPRIAIEDGIVRFARWYEATQR